MESEPKIYDLISRLSRTMHGPNVRGSMTPEQVLNEVTEAAVQVLGGVDHAGVTLVRRTDPGRNPDFLESVAATGAVPQLFDSLQQAHGEGPCFEAIWTEQTVRILDARTEHRWPALMAAIGEQTPIRSVLSIQLYIDGQELGALNLFSDSPDRLVDDTEDMALNLATHAAIALSGARRGQQFRSALASRDIIGQAKGIVMERFDVDAVRAFTMLSTLSQESNVPLAELATQLVQRDHPTVENE